MIDESEKKYEELKNTKNKAECEKLKKQLKNMEEQIFVSMTEHNVIIPMPDYSGGTCTEEGYQAS